MASGLRVKIFDSTGTQSIPIAKPTCTVGRAAHCDVVLDHPSIESEHLRIWVDGGHIWVQDVIGRNDCSLNDSSLPFLKPMIVRDLDTLRVAQCPATIGLEVNLVRSPRLGSDAETQIIHEKVHHFKDPKIESSQVELEELKRELADLRLKIQMEKLEISSAAELNRKIIETHEDNEALTQEKKNLVSQIKKLNEEYTEKVRELEVEIADVKLRALRQMKDQKDTDAKRFGAWKQEAWKVLFDRVRALNARKGQQWNERPFEHSMFSDWEAEFRKTGRLVLLDESTPEDETFIGVPIQSTPAPKTRKNRAKKVTRNQWIGAVGVAVAFAIVLFLGFTFFPKLKSKSASTDSSSQLKSKPEKTFVISESYAENAVRVEGFLSRELNSTHSQAWKAALMSAGTNEWRLSDKTTNAIFRREQELLLSLKEARESAPKASPKELLARMRKLEIDFQSELDALTGNKFLKKKVAALKQKFYSRQPSSTRKKP